MLDWDAEADIAEVMAANPGHTKKAVGDGYEFYPQEVRLAKVLLVASGKAADTLLERYDQITGISQKASRNIDLAKALQGLAPIMLESWDAKTEERVADLIGDLADVGARRAGAFQKFKDMPSRPLMEKGMVASAKYYSNSYFNRVILPGLAGDIRKKLDTDGEFDDAFFRATRAKIDSRLKSVPHWKLVANQAASRSYHYGLVRAGMIANYVAYRYVAVLDEKTTSLCESLNGRSFWIADAVDHVERLARTDPEDLKAEFPWADTTLDISEMTTKQLVGSGLMVPPLHGSCRSSIRLLKS